ncbi:MAG: hypothetical protein AMQ22_02060 [Candidatus Methanofastidiosum methylothiophilum]|uniref:Uncharacterized protein n=1 Tax=Candidatus Methanofastidiosum methylothiophilum TaxID=1705564 RepID=A0A150INW6_9EURY|nr:MAG: hypothetical protein AMQ22_02060 [Candidatus Methanofastidiosum methylthiophilus]OPY24949.1 MAG: hypothetical protein A4E26_00082 [Methanobacterium sp. PtaU1.Bin097]
MDLVGKKVSILYNLFSLYILYNYIYYIIYLIDSCFNYSIAYFRSNFYKEMLNYERRTRILR